MLGFQSNEDCSGRKIQMRNQKDFDNIVRLIQRFMDFRFVTLFLFNKAGNEIVGWEFLTFKDDLFYLA